MSVVVWWAIPLLATIIAVIWLSWRARPRPGDPHDTVEQRRRFDEAMQKAPRGRRRGSRATSTDESSTERSSTTPEEPIA